MWTRALVDCPLQPYAERLKLPDTPTPFPIPDDNRFEGTWIVAPPRRGKTNLLLNLVAEDLKRGTVICLDSKGELLDPLRHVSHQLIDPRTATINPLKIGTHTHSVEFIEYIFGALLNTEMTSKQKTLFSSVLRKRCCAATL